MANNFKTSTDTSGASSVVATTEKPVILISSKETTGTGVASTLFDIIGTADTAEAFGVTSKMVSVVKYLIKNGATSIKGIIVPAVVAPATISTVYQDVFDSLLNINYKSAVFVVAATDSAVNAELVTFLGSAEDENKFFYGVIAPLVTDITPTMLVTTAGVLNCSRLFYPAPVLTSDGSNVDPTLVQAAIAAKISSETDDPALPMNNVELIGFDGVSQTFRGADLTTLVNGGVTPIIVPTGGTNPVVYRLVTTRTKDSAGASEKIWQEGTTRFSADYVLNNVVTRLMANYKRTKKLSRVLDAIRTDVIDVCTKCDALEIIENFDKNTVTVRNDPEDNYGCLVDYSIDIVTPLYTITITQHVKL